MTIIVNYLQIQDSNATPENFFYAYNSTDSGNNSGWVINAGNDSDKIRLAESGAVITGKSSNKPAGTVSRLGGAGGIEANMLDYKNQYNAPVSGLTVKGRLINKAKGYI
jgi:hypothetical protein